MKSSEAFDAAYKRLNKEQKLAVDTVEGPVMVIAGPGTGKTHILTLRIANILKETQATPDSILVLTFTESAARTVRKRLIPLIGEEAAYRVAVHTFHNFAGTVLSEYGEHFPAYAERRLAGNVETTLLWREVLETEEVKLLRTPKAPFYYLNELSRLREELTRERVTLAEYRAWLDAEIAGAGSDEKKQTRFLKGYEAARLIEAYETLKEERGVYDFTDVLRIVVDGLAEDDGLKAALQERYQYILADEHQDANALQHALLDAFALDDYPNIFVVGDEKQAVFGFQGADATHFKKFVESFPRTKVIALVESYRSYQSILDIAQAPLRASRGQGGRAQLLIAPDPLVEREQVAELVEASLKEGIKPHEVAIIARTNPTADLFALHLAARGVPVLRAGDVDLESRPNIRFLLALMRAVAFPGDVAALREALLAPWWNVSISERAELLRQSRDSELREALTEKFSTVASIFDELQNAAQTAAPLEILSRIIAESGARDYFLSNAEAFPDIPLVRQIIMHIEGLVSREPSATFAELMETFTKAKEHGLGGISSSITSEEGRVTVITAHKAKGMEFSRVFVVGLTAKEWEKGGRAPLIPSPLSKPRELSESVKLLYAALTRAKDELTLSYAEGTSEGRETPPSELLPSGLELIAPAAISIPVLHTTIDAPALVRDLTVRYLEHDGLSPSAFNEYLESPTCFFAKRVLRLKEPETPAIALGNAVHAGIAGYLKAENEAKTARIAKARAELERSLKRSLLRRTSAFDHLSRQAHAYLDSYLGSALLLREAVAVEKTYSTARTILGKKVLLKGKIDAVFKGEGGECLVDFKTSSSISKDDKEKFERQIAFYDLLLRADGHAPDSALIVQIGEEGVKEHGVGLDADTRAQLKETLDVVLEEMISGHWREGEPSEYDALLKLFEE